MRPTGMSDQDVNIVVTDASGTPQPRLTRRSPCPVCKASAERRTESCGFGPVELRKVICGGCGFQFPKEALV